MNYKYFRYIILQRILYYITGDFLVQYVWDWWHVRVMKLPPYWGDAEYCNRTFCRYCGAGTPTP